MRKSLLVLGAIYSIAGVYGLSLLSKLLSLYREYNLNVPITSIAWIITILFFGTINWILYFSKNKSKLLQQIVIALGILGIALYLGATFYSSYKAKQMFREVINSSNTQNKYSY